MTIIGLLGKARAGKDTVGGFIKSAVTGAETIALADPIKAICGKLFNFSQEQLYGDLKEVPDKRYPRKCDDCGGNGLCSASMREYGHTTTPCSGPCGGTGEVFLTPRWALQYVGTQIARALYADVWIDYGLRRADGMIEGSLVKTGNDQFITGVPDLDRRSVVAFTDVRFINEAHKIVANGGVVWRIVRPDRKKILSLTYQAHASEMEQESAEIDQYVSNVVMNDRGLTELEAAVKVALNQIGDRPTTQDLVAQEEGDLQVVTWQE